MKISFITTVFNEEETIDLLLDSISSQTKLPYEIIIVDGGSTDKTVKKIEDCSSRLRLSNNSLVLKLFIKKGNRAMGRNEAIKQAKGDIILCTDAGCILDRKWVEEIIKPFSKKKVDVVAGYYKGKWENIFQKSIIPYVLVIDDKVNPRTFLPASRSMAFKKTIWEKVGGFNEKLSNNEDYEFAKKLKKNNAKIFFQKTAIVNWNPRRNLLEAFTMFYRFAYGDIEAGIIRPKVILVLTRYLLVLVFLICSFVFSPYIMLSFFILTWSLYVIWSIYKNYRYVRDIRAFYYLPLLQLTSDIAVLSGSIIGFFAKFRN